MSMTRDSYAKEVIRVAEAAFCRNETPVCPHEKCSEHLSIVRQSMYSKRSLFCPVHGHIYQEQSVENLSKLDWDKAAENVYEDDLDTELDDDFDSDEEDYE